MDLEDVLVWLKWAAILFGAWVVAGLCVGGFVGAAVMAFRLISGIQL